MTLSRVVSFDGGVGGMLEMVQKVAEEKGLALLLQPDHRVELGLGSLRNDLVQEVDVGRGYFHVHQKIGAVG